MKLFELYAELGLDASKFASGVSDAKTNFQGLETDIKANAKTIDDEIAALDAEIAALDKSIASMELDIEIDDLEGEIKALEDDIRKADFKAAFMDGFYEGLLDASKDLLKEAIEAGFEFLGESVEYAAESGSRAADKYNAAIAKVDLASENLKSTIGEALLPVLTSAYDKLAEIFGITDVDLAFSMLDNLSEYEFNNLQTAEQSLKNIFSMGEQWEASESELDFDSVIAGYESQTRYWEEYTKALSDLRQKGFTEEILAPYTSGAESDLETLQWLASLTEDQVTRLQESSDAVEAARKQTAETISDIQLWNDQEYLDMVSEYERLARMINQAGGFQIDDSGYIILPPEGDNVPAKKSVDYGATDEWGFHAGSGNQEYDFGFSNGEYAWEDVKASEETGAAIEAVNASIESLNSAVSTLQSTAETMTDAAASAAASAAAGAVSGASVVMDGRAVGAIVAPYVSSALVAE